MAKPTATQKRTQQRISHSLAEIGFALPGRLLWRSTTCGNTGCRCHNDPPVLHGPYLTWTRAVAGKTITRKITDEQQARYQAWFVNARQLRQLVTELETLSLQAFEQAEATSRRT